MFVEFFEVFVGTCLLVLGELVEFAGLKFVLLSDERKIFFYSYLVVHVLLINFLIFALRICLFFECGLNFLIHEFFHGLDLSFFFGDSLF